MPASELITTTTSEISELGTFLQNFLRIITSPELQRQLFVVKIVFLVFCAAFLVMILYLLATTSYLDWVILSDVKNFFFPKFFERRNLFKTWKKIKEGIGKKAEAHWKLSVIEAVRFFDRILDELGYSGEVFEEKLQKLSQDEIATAKALLHIKDTCRDIIRDPDYKLAKSRAKEILDVIEKTLVDLEVI